MTEVDRAGITRSDSTYALGGPNGTTHIERVGGEMHIAFDERTKPFFQRMPRRVTGRIRLMPEATFDNPVHIDAAQQHTWWGVAPHARVEVELDSPGLKFSGRGYHDCNRGHEGLEDGFRSWNWSRAELPHGTAVLYDTLDRAGQTRDLGWIFGADGSIRPFDPPQKARLKRATWGIDRETRVDAGGTARISQTLIASPFYARSVLETTLDGHRAVGVHESLDCDRFAAPWVRFLLPWRIRGQRR